MNIFHYLTMFCIISSQLNLNDTVHGIQLRNVSVKSNILRWQNTCFYWRAVSGGYYFIQAWSLIYTLHIDTYRYTQIYIDTQRYTQKHIHRYIAIYLCVSMCMLTYVYTCIYLYLFLSMCAHRQIKINTHRYTYTQVHIDTHTYTYIHIDTRTQQHTDTIHIVAQ